MILESVSRIMIISCVYPILPLSLCMPSGFAAGAVDGTDGDSSAIGTDP